MLTHQHLFSVMPIHATTLDDVFLSSFVSQESRKKEETKSILKTSIQQTSTRKNNLNS